MKQTFTVTWAGVASWSGPLGEIDNAVHALAMVKGLTERGMRNISIMAINPDSTSRAIDVLELARMAAVETTVNRA
jgi:hypothetical protein